MVNGPTGQNRPVKKIGVPADERIEQTSLEA